MGFVSIHIFEMRQPISEKANLSSSCSYWLLGGQRLSEQDQTLPAHPRNLQIPPVDMAGQCCQARNYHCFEDRNLTAFLDFPWGSCRHEASPKIWMTIICSHWKVQIADFGSLFSMSFMSFSAVIENWWFFKSKKCGTSKQPSCELVMATFGPESAAPETKVWSFSVVNPNFMKPKVHH